MDIKKVVQIVGYMLSKYQHLAADALGKCSSNMLR